MHLVLEPNLSPQLPPQVTTLVTEQLPPALPLAVPDVADTLPLQFQMVLEHSHWDWQSATQQPCELTRARHET